jgi:hypothetical protein
MFMHVFCMHHSLEDIAEMRLRMWLPQMKMGFQTRHPCFRWGQHHLGKLELHGRIDAGKDPLEDDEQTWAKLECSRAILMAEDSISESAPSLGSCSRDCSPTFSRDLFHLAHAITPPFSLLFPPCRPGRRVAEQPPKWKPSPGTNTLTDGNMS